MNEYRKAGLPELARVAVVREDLDGEVALGFNSPLTLFCPTPIEDDERREFAWGALWQALTGSERPRDWRTEEMAEWRPAGLAVRQVRTWIEREKRLREGTAPPWTHAFAEHPRLAPATFGRGRTLSAYWGAGADAAPVTLALPTESRDDWWPDEETPTLDGAALPAALASALQSATTEAGVTFESVDFTPPAPHQGSGERHEPMRALWREHLDHLQMSGDIAAFGVRADERRLALLTADHRAAAIIENVIVLDRDDIMVRDCTPMRQDPAARLADPAGNGAVPRLSAEGGLPGPGGDRRRPARRRPAQERRGGPSPRSPQVDAGPRRPAPGGGRSATGASSFRRSRPGGAASAEERARTRDHRPGSGLDEYVESVADRLRAGRRGSRQPGLDWPTRGRAHRRRPRRRGSRLYRATRPGAPRNDESARGASSGGGVTRRTAKTTWELRLAGRNDRVSIVLEVPPEDAADGDDEHHRAHWMVWPRFRSTEAPPWRAYYVYEHCTNGNLHPATLWLDPDDGCVRRREPPARGGAHPVRFTGGDRRAHTGGPPLAFSLENRATGREQGLYVINLDALPRRQGEVNVGIDFGTSHTVAAVQADGGKHLVELAPELDGTRKDALTLHVSENWSHVTDRDLGLKRLGVWLPTYTDDPVPRERQGLLPSELLTIEPWTKLGGDDLSQWQPGRDCVIPFMDMQRSDLAAHLVSDFKWRASAPPFRERESALREIYLGMALELVMADVVGRRLGRLPAEVDLTFTYPLRDSIEQVQGFQRTLRRVLDSGGRSLGTTFRLADGIGIYNESSAAKGGTRVFGEVCLVGDLGGGTLDLFISAEGGPGIDFEEVADSAKLGGNELLRTMAEHPDRFLPPGWADRSEDAETQLRAWMRSKGSPRFLGSAGEPERHAGLGVTGFARPAESKAARALIARYFRLLAEYMARSLVAYLVRHWHPQVLKQRPGDRERLRVLVQLRGNGWRLWPEHTDYAEIERRVAERVAERAAELWRDRAGDRDAWRDQDHLWRKHGLWKETAGGGQGGPTVDAPACAPEGSREVNPKAAPILRVVGRAQRHDDIRACSHALVELEVVTDRKPAQDGAGPKIRWFDRLPAEIGASNAKVEFHRIEPPFLLSHPGDAMRRVLDDLEPKLKHDINEELHELGVWSEVDFKAPIAAVVWEHAFRSRRFVEGQ